MVCLGFEPGATEWWAQAKPRSYSGHCGFLLFTYVTFNANNCDLHS